MCNTLAEILSSQVRAEILRLLFGLNRNRLHVREMERRSSLTISTLRQDLKKLAGLDLVVGQRDGNRLYYEANTAHPLYATLHELVMKTAGLVDILAARLAANKVRVAFVFGSVARGETRGDSDIDLLIIGDLTLREASKAVSGVEQTAGRDVNPTVLTEAEFAARFRCRDHFLMRVLESQKLFVVGDERELAAVGSESLAE